MSQTIQTTEVNATTINLYRSTPRVIRQYVIDCLTAGLVPYVKGSPGIGKSAMMRYVASMFGLCLIDCRLSGMSAEDLTGLPNFLGSKAVYYPFDTFPIEGQEVPAGYDGWLLFFDEFNSSDDVRTMAACYKVLLDRMIGQHKLHDRVMIACAGNLETDKAIVSPLSTALQSRVVTMEMYPEYNEWQEDVAIPGSYDHRVIGYLGQYPSELMDFDPNHKERSFCSPRTWEFTSKLSQLWPKAISHDKIGLLAGTITSGVAAKFVTFTDIYTTLISMRDILADPTGCDLPRDNSTRWALITHVMEHIDEKNYGKLAEYANRFPLPFRILFFRMVNVRHPKLREHEAFRKAMTELHKHLNSPA